MENGFYTRILKNGWSIFNGFVTRGLTFPGNVILREELSLEIKEKGIIIKKYYTPH
jgi:hypothetical protein